MKFQSAEFLLPIIDFEGNRGNMMIPRVTKDVLKRGKASEER